MATFVKTNKLKSSEYKKNRKKLWNLVCFTLDILYICFDRNYNFSKIHMSLSDKRPPDPEGRFVSLPYCVRMLSIQDFNLGPMNIRKNWINIINLKLIQIAP